MRTTSTDPLATQVNLSFWSSRFGFSLRTASMVSLATSGGLQCTPPLGLQSCSEEPPIKSPFRRSITLPKLHGPKLVVHYSDHVVEPKAIQHAPWVRKLAEIGPSGRHACAKNKLKHNTTEYTLKETARTWIRVHQHDPMHCLQKPIRRALPAAPRAWSALSYHMHCLQKPIRRALPAAPRAWSALSGT